MCYVVATKNSHGALRGLNSQKKGSVSYAKFERFLIKKDVQIFKIYIHAYVQQKDVMKNFCEKNNNIFFTLYIWNKK